MLHTNEKRLRKEFLQLLLRGRGCSEELRWVVATAAATRMVGGSEEMDELIESDASTRRVLAMALGMGMWLTVFLKVIISIVQVSICERM
jgi:hypothetical protein